MLTLQRIYLFQFQSQVMTTLSSNGSGSVKTSNINNVYSIDCPEVVTQLLPYLPCIAAFELLQVTAPLLAYRREAMPPNPLTFPPTCSEFTKADD